MKDQLQKEILAKVKEGVKPSDLKQLKRSKSTGDLPKAPPLPKLTKSKSAPELEPTNSKIEQLETKISTLELKLEVSQRELAEKDAEQQLFAEQLKEKQKEIEKLREKLETRVNLNELDRALVARHKSLKDWFKQYQKTKQLEAELSENIDQASTELVSQDQTIANLRSENNKLKQTNSQLTQDLKLTQRLAEMRKSPLPDENWPPFPWNLTTLVLSALALWIWIKKPHD